MPNSSNGKLPNERGEPMRKPLVSKRNTTSRTNRKPSGVIKPSMMPTAELAKLEKSSARKLSESADGTDAKLFRLYPRDYWLALK